MGLKIAVEPSGGPDGKTKTELNRETVARSLTSSDVEVVAPEDAEALVWLDVHGADGLQAILERAPGLKWVQLPWAGVESFASAGLLERDITFTCAKGAYGQQVGEHALTLVLACVRHLSAQARNPGWMPIEAESLFDKRVTILGAGGIAETLILLLTPFRCDITVVRRSTTPAPGANRTVATGNLDDVLPSTDVLVLALPLTNETRGIIGARQLALLPSTAVVVNVARGGHVDTSALVDALKNGSIAAAGLDVTDPEPLPADHPLWKFDNVLITSHSADSFAFVTEKLVERIQENVARFTEGRSLLGVVDPGSGY